MEAADENLASIRPGAVSRVGVCAHTMQLSDIPHCRIGAPRAVFQRSLLREPGLFPGRPVDHRCRSGVASIRFPF